MAQALLARVTYKLVHQTRAKLLFLRISQIFTNMAEKCQNLLYQNLL